MMKGKWKLAWYDFEAGRKTMKSNLEDMTVNPLNEIFQVEMNYIL